MMMRLTNDMEYGIMTVLKGKKLRIWENALVNIFDVLRKRENGEGAKALVCDVHAHIAPGVDDGACDIEMAMAMLRAEEEQGAVAVFATSHNSCKADAYERSLREMRATAGEAGLGLRIYSGREIFFGITEEKRALLDIQNPMYRMNGTKYAMVEYEPYASAGYIIYSIKRIRENTDVIPIIAHAERYSSLSISWDTVNELISLGAMLQVNAYSLSDERDAEIAELARRLVIERKVSFIGSDCHRTDHRPPKLENGIRFIYQSCDRRYAEAICIGNCRKYLGIDI